jgi:hypothetical protein
MTRVASTASFRESIRATTRGTQAQAPQAGSLDPLRPCATRAAEILTFGQPSFNWDPELAGVLSLLPEDARRIVLDRLARRSSARLDARDQAIHELAVEFYSHLDRRHRAAAIAHSLDRETALPATAMDEKRTALRTILSLNRGRSLTRQHVGNILAGARSYPGRAPRKRMSEPPAGMAGRSKKGARSLN